VASKFGVRGLTDALRQELADVPGIHVCNVLPGSIDTPLFPPLGEHTFYSV